MLIDRTDDSLKDPNASAVSSEALGSWLVSLHSGSTTAAFVTPDAGPQGNQMLLVDQTSSVSRPLGCRPSTLARPNIGSLSIDRK